ncbi:hypothetical protein GCM10027185_30820 [Spirosoma pulveris]
MGYTQSISQTIAIGVEGGRVMAEFLAYPTRVERWVEHDRGGVGQQGRIDVNRRRDEETDLVGGSRWRKVFGVSIPVGYGYANGIGSRSGIRMDNGITVNR